jgi:hypothetical protein
MTNTPENDDSNGKKPDAPGNDPEGYKVGYGRPPLHKCWKARSGNPSGRRREQETYGDLLDRIQREKILGYENGKRVSITKRRAWARTVVDRGIAGNPACEDILIKFERPDLSPPSGLSGSLHIEHVNSDDEIPARRRELMKRHRSRRKQHSPFPGAGVNSSDGSLLQQERPGNRRGRPGNDAAFAELIKRELNRRIKVEENGRTRTMTKREAWMRRIVNGALNGNARCLKIYMKFVKPIESPSGGDMYFFIVGAN